MNSIIIFVFAYLFIFILIAMLLSITGLDFLSAISGAATSISNVGPGLGEMIGPNGNFKAIPEVSKWLYLAWQARGSYHRWIRICCHTLYQRFIRRTGEGFKAACLIRYHRLSHHWQEHRSYRRREMVRCDIHRGSGSVVAWWHHTLGHHPCD